MNYKEFTKTLLEQLAQKSEWNICEKNIKYYKNGFTSTDKMDLDFIRYTNIRYYKSESDTLIGDYIVILTEGKNELTGMSRFSVEDLYQSFQQKGWDLVWDTIKENLDMSKRVDETGVLEQIHDYHAIKERLIIRPINFTDHRYELKDCIYKRIGDIALILYLIIYDTKEQGLGTVRIPKPAVEEWNLDIETVWEDALLNTNVMAPPRIYFNPLDCYNPPYTKGAFMALGSEITKIERFQIPSITTTKQTNGAIALFYPGVKERLAQMMNGSFYVAFTSIHEASLHCKGSIAPLQILRQIKDINKAFNPAEILTRKVFYYDAEKNTFDALEL